MVKLLIIADDFTGALDTGVQFSKMGIDTMVTAIIDENLVALDKETEVLVIDTESRYLTFEKSYERIKKIILAAKKAKIPYIYKKVDSALRGNISAEIKAILDTSQEATIPFLPAYPEMNRVLIEGKLYIDGRLVSESIFAKDPYEPVTESDVIVRLKNEAQIDSVLIKKNEHLKDEKGLLVFDSQTEEDLQKQLTALDDSGLLNVSIGCAGFAKLLSKRLFHERPLVDYCIQKPVIVVSGSVNAITKKQIEHAEEKNYPRISLSMEQLLTPDYWKSKKGDRDIQNYLSIIKERPLVVFETLSEKTNEELREVEMNTADQAFRFKIGQSLGTLTESLWQRYSKGTFLFTGGDTLFQSMKVLGVNQIKPQTEISTGVVLSTIQWQEKEIQVITKSGGFGHRELFEDIIQTVT